MSDQNSSDRLHRLIQNKMQAMDDYLSSKNSNENEDEFQQEAKEQKTVRDQAKQTSVAPQETINTQQNDENVFAKEDESQRMKQKGWWRKIKGFFDKLLGILPNQEKSMDNSSTSWIFAGGGYNFTNQIGDRDTDMVLKDCLDSPKVVHALEDGKKVKHITIKDALRRLQVKNRTGYNFCWIVVFINCICAVIPLPAFIRLPLFAIIYYILLGHYAIPIISNKVLRGRLMPWRLDKEKNFQRPRVVRLIWHNYASLIETISLITATSIMSVFNLVLIPFLFSHTYFLRLFSSAVVIAVCLRVRHFYYNQFNNLFSGVSYSQWIEKSLFENFNVNRYNILPLRALLHADELDENKPNLYLGKSVITGGEVFLPVADRRNACIFVGANGTGKSSSLYVPQIVQDIVSFLAWFRKNYNSMPQEIEQPKELNSIIVVDTSNALCKTIQQIATNVFNIPKELIHFLDVSNPNTDSINLMRGNVSQATSVINQCINALCKGDNQQYFLQAQQTWLGNITQLVKIPSIFQVAPATFSEFCDVCGDLSLVDRYLYGLKKYRDLMAKICLLFYIYAGNFPSLHIQRNRHFEKEMQILFANTTDQTFIHEVDKIKKERHFVLRYYHLAVNYAKQNNEKPLYTVRPFISSCQLINDILFFVDKEHPATERFGLHEGSFDDLEEILSSRLQITFNEVYSSYKTADDVFKWVTEHIQRLYVNQDKNDIVSGQVTEMTKKLAYYNAWVNAMKDSDEKTNAQNLTDQQKVQIYDAIQANLDSLVSNEQANDDKQSTEKEVEEVFQALKQCFSSKDKDLGKIKNLNSVETDEYKEISKNVELDYFFDNVADKQIMYVDRETTSVKGLKNIIHSLTQNKDIRAVLLNDKDNDNFSMQKFYQDGGLLLFYTGKDMLGDMSSVYASMIQTVIYTFAQKRPTKDGSPLAPLSVIYNDEAIDYITEDFKSYPAQLRKFNISIDIAIQSLSQISQKFGEGYLKNLLATMRNKFAMHDQNADDARKFSEMFGKHVDFVDAGGRMSSQGVVRSGRYMEVPNVTPEDLATDQAYTVSCRINVNNELQPYDQFRVTPLTYKVTTNPETLEQTVELSDELRKLYETKRFGKYASDEECLENYRKTITNRNYDFEGINKIIRDYFLRWHNYKARLDQKDEASELIDNRPNFAEDDPEKAHISSHQYVDYFHEYTDSPDTIFPCKDSAEWQAIINEENFTSNEQFDNYVAGVPSFVVQELEIPDNEIDLPFFNAGYYILNKQDEDEKVNDIVDWEEGRKTGDIDPSSIAPNNENNSFTNHHSLNDDNKDDFTQSTDHTNYSNANHENTENNASANDGNTNSYANEEPSSSSNANQSLCNNGSANNINNNVDDEINLDDINGTNDIDGLDGIDDDSKNENNTNHENTENKINVNDGNANNCVDGEPSSSNENNTNHAPSSLPKSNIATSTNLNNTTNEFSNTQGSSASQTSSYANINSTSSANANQAPVKNNATSSQVKSQASVAKKAKRNRHQINDDDNTFATEQGK